jgi:hypothetical protein
VIGLLVAPPQIKETTTLTVLVAFYQGVAIFAYWMVLTLKGSSES